MPIDAWAFATEQELDEHREMLRWWRQNRGTDGDVTRPETRIDVKQPLLVVLLDDLLRGQAVKASVLEPRSTLNQTQVISALGAPYGGLMKWGFNPSMSALTGSVEWTENIYPLVDDANAIELKLGKLPSLALADVTVTGGLIRTGEAPDIVTHNTWRWQVTFGGKYAGRDLLPLQIQSQLLGGYTLVESVTDWEDTGRVVDVREVIGVPFPTPAKRGARAWVEWKSRAGWCVTAIEPRDFGDYGLFN